MKILIISHNPITTYQNMGKTIASLFFSVKKEDVCQLYIYPTIPDTDVCSSYYRVTDKDVLASFYKFSVKGSKISPDLTAHSMFEEGKDEQLYRNPKNSSPIRRMGRDAMWKLAHWYNKSLKTWLDEQAPTHIFVAPGTAKFMYNIALKIAKDRNIPIVTYICDDYYFVKPEKTFLARFRQKSFHKKVEQLMHKSTHVITICKSLEEAYFEKFKVPTTTVMTGSNYDISEDVNVTDDACAIRYMGNIRCNRYVPLAEIGRALDEINAEKGTKYSLEIFTSENDEGILSTFNGINSIKMCGYVSGEEFDKTFRASQILLHTEAFDEDSIDLVKNSVSTKIADSLGSGIPFFAYGPSQVASMRHLIDNDCAMLAIEQSMLKEVLLKAFTDKAFREEKAKNGLSVAKKYHDRHAVGDEILKIFEGIK